MLALGTSLADWTRFLPASLIVTTHSSLSITPPISFATSLARRPLRVGSVYPLRWCSDTGLLLFVCNCGRQGEYSQTSGLFAADPTSATSDCWSFHSASRQDDVDTIYLAQSGGPRHIWIPPLGGNWLSWLLSIGFYRFGVSYSSANIQIWARLDNSSFTGVFGFYACQRTLFSRSSSCSVVCASCSGRSFGCFVFWLTPASSWLLRELFRSQAVFRALFGSVWLLFVRWGAWPCCEVD